MDLFFFDVTSWPLGVMMTIMYSCYIAHVVSILIDSRKELDNKGGSNGKTIDGDNRRECEERN